MIKFKIQVKYIELEEGVLENWLAAFENTLKIRLPKDYRNHMLKYNGGFPVGDYVIFDADSAGVSVDENIHVQSFDELDNGKSSFQLVHRIVHKQTTQHMGSHFQIEKLLDLIQ